MICIVKSDLVYRRGVSKDAVRDEICAQIVRLLTDERKRRQLSGNSLAEKAGLSQSLISSLETNPWNPTIGTLLRIAEVLEVDLGEIITKAQKKVLRNRVKG